MPMSKLTLKRGSRVDRGSQKAGRGRGYKVSRSFHGWFRAMTRARAPHEAWVPITRKARRHRRLAQNGLATNACLRMRSPENRGQEMKAIVRHNVLLMSFAKREPFYADAARIWSLAERGQIDARFLRSALTTFTTSFGEPRIGKRPIRRCTLSERFTAVPLNAQVFEPRD